MLKKFALISTLLLFSNFIFSQTKKYEANFVKTPAAQAIDILEEKYGLLFSYKKTDLEGIFISETNSGHELPLFLENIFSGHGIEVEIINGNYVILKKTENNLGTINEGKIEVNICGTILDSLTNEPLIGANIYIKEKGIGTISDINGDFIFKDSVHIDDWVTISYVGYKEVSILISDLIGPGCKEISLGLSDDWVGGCGITITAEYLTDGIDLERNGTINNISPQKTNALPGQVEPDVFSTVKFLPGISSPTGETSNLNIRGGASDQNLILWENIPIYHSAHYFGMISAFNPYIIRNIKVYRGGFGPEYGGRISGIIDMSSDWGFRDRPRFGAGLNFLNAYTYGQSSFLNKKASVAYSVRQSISDIWRSPTFQNIARRNQQGQLFENFDVYDLPNHISVSDEFNFTDMHLKTKFQITGEDELSAAFFYGKNNFKDLISDDIINQRQADTINLNNYGVNLSWRREWGDLYISELSGVVTEFENDYDFEIDFLESMQRDVYGFKKNKLTEKQLNFSNLFHFQNDFKLNIGYQFVGYDINYHIKTTGAQNTDTDEKREYDSNVHSVYSGIKTKADGKHGMDAGVRWSYFGFTGKNYFEPRLHLWSRILPFTVFSFNIGKYNQYIGQLVQLKGNNIGIETPIWTMTGGKGIPVLNATQVQFGSVYRKNKWLVDVQLYSKKINGLTSLATGFDPTPGHILGKSKTRGMDILVKKRWSNFRSWFSYSLSQTDFMFERFFDEEFPAPFDQRHQLAWVNLFDYKKFSFSFGLEITSGNPYAVMTDFEKIQTGMGLEIFQPIYEEYNGSRLGIQHRVDFSAMYKFHKNKNGKLKGHIGISVSNLFDQKNIYARDYFIDRKPNLPPRISFVDKAQMGFTPNMVVRVEFGGLGN